MADTCRLTYFEGWGLAEQARWMLAASDIAFEQVALQEHADFAALRDSGALMFRQLPLVEIDGLKLVQSQAIVRYLGRRGGMAGATDAESAKIDMVCEAARDARGVVAGYPFNSDKAAWVAAIPGKIGKFLDGFEAAIGPLEGEAKQAEGEAGAGAGVGAGAGAVGVVPSGLSTADVLLANLVEDVHHLVEGGLEHFAEYPKLRALHAQVVARPGVAAYLASEKRFPFPAEGEVCDVYVKNVNTVLGR